MDYILNILNDILPIIEICILAGTIEKIWLIGKDIKEIKNKLNI